MRELDYKESWAPKNWCFCGIGEDSWESLGQQGVHLVARSFQQGDNQSILKEISLECSLEGLMLKLKLQYFGHLMARTDSFENPWCWERLKVGGEGNNRGLDGWMASLMWRTWVWAGSGNWWWTGKPGMLGAVHGVAKSQTRLSDWTDAESRRMVLMNLFAVQE